MMRKHATMLITIGFASLCIAGLVLFPLPMLSPGNVLKPHRSFAGECRKCHLLFHGTTTALCEGCHKPGMIGVLTVGGVPIKKNVTPFHADLTIKQCITCHVEHDGTGNRRRSRAFAHDMLRNVAIQKCWACHRLPSKPAHVGVATNCKSCHSATKWRPATVSHKEEELPRVDDKQACLDCHKAPDKRYHLKLGEDCGKCHTTNGWKPAKFEHRKHFRLDRKHRADCATCHTGNEYNRYTCYGCHEHKERKVRRKHLGKGMRDWEKCVRCHRSSDEDDAERIWHAERRRQSPGGTRREHD